MRDKYHKRIEEYSAALKMHRQELADADGKRGNPNVYKLDKTPVPLSVIVEGMEGTAGRFATVGRAAFERYKLCQGANGTLIYQPYDNFGWLDPEFGGWQMEYCDIIREPFHITGQTPIPDPAAY